MRWCLGCVWLCALLACAGAEPEARDARPAAREVDPGHTVSEGDDPSVAEPDDAPEPAEHEDAAPPAPSAQPSPTPDGFTDLAKLPGLRVEARYATANNFTGAPLPGYEVGGAWLLDGPAEALGRVQRRLEADGYGLLVYDAYRPLRATKAMVDWAHRTDQVHLLNDGYIARRSNHNRGNTVDLTLVHLSSGEPLDMGTPWDTLDERAHTRNAQGEVAANRQRLVAAMRAEGFKNYWKEWWHFSHGEGADAPHRDVPYGVVGE